MATEGQLAAARAAAEADATRRAAAEKAAAAAAHENACLHSAVADLAASEQAWKQRAEAAEAGLAEATKAAAEQQWRLQQQDRAAGASRDHIQLLQATLAEQAGQLEALRQRDEQQKSQLAGLQTNLQAAGERQAATQAAADELAAVKFSLERSLHKQTVLAQQLQEQSVGLHKELQAASKGLAAAEAHAQDLGGQLAREREEHQATTAAQQAAHEQRRARWAMLACSARHTHAATAALLHSTG